MRRAAFYLLLCTARNRARRTLRQMRSPRYLVALVLGLVYLGLVFFGQRHRPMAQGPFTPQAIEVGGTFLLLVLVAKWWLFGAERTALAFTPAEIQFLFPAPVSRAALLCYKLARTQILILLNVLIWTFLLRRGASGVLGTGVSAISLWLVFSTISLHRLGVALTRQAAVEHGRAGLRRLVLPLVALAAGAGIVWTTIAGLDPLAFAEDPLAVVAGAMATPPLAWLLWPFRLPLLPLVAGSVGEWLPRAGIAFAILAVHLAWVLRADRAFEEAALAASAYRADLLKRLRGTGYRAPDRPSAPRRWFRLVPEGHPIGAIVWKNLTRVARATSPGLIAMIAAAAGIGLAVGLFQRAENPVILTAVGMLALTWGGALVLLGPLWIRADLRGDMEHLSLLKTWPVGGLEVMTGQVLGSAVVLTTLQGAFGVVALAALGGIGAPAALTPLLTLTGAPLALTALFGVNLLAIAIQNAGALLYPAWVSAEIRPGGIEAVGQQMLTAGVSMVLLAVLLVGPLLLAGGAFYFTSGGLGVWATFPALVLGIAGMAIEAWLLLDWLGDQFERSDPSLN